jgi:hypothetical protein
MAKTLRELESYKLLCERKVLELVPGHPLPLQPGHLGQHSSRSGGKGGRQESSREEPKVVQQQLHQLQQTVAKLTAENQQLRLTLAGKPSRSQPATQPDALLELQRRVEKVEGEKMAVDESLRNEMLVNEEQRKYIEVLKEALETKIEDLGFTQLLQRTQARDKDSQDVCDIFAEMARSKRELDEKHQELAKNEVLAPDPRLERRH